MKITTTIGIACAVALLASGCANSGAQGTPEPTGVGASETTAATGQYATLRDAIAADDGAAVTAMLAAGEDPNQDLGGGVTPLHAAASTDRAHAVQALIDGGADLDARAGTVGTTPLMAAASSGGADALKVLLDAGADVFIGEMTGPSAGPMQVAAREDNVAALQALLDFGLDVDQIEPGKSSPLIWAAYYGKEEASFFLIDNGADLDAVDVVGQGVIENAELGGFPDLAQKLRDAGATK